MTAVASETELRRLAHERKVFERAAQLSPNLVYLIDPGQRRVTWSSRATTPVLGFELGELTQDALRHNMPDDAARASDDVVRAQGLIDGAHHEATYRVRDAIGEDRWLLVRITPFERDAGGRVTELLAIATDVTPLKHAEARAAESEQTLAGRVDVLEAILETAGEGILVADDHAQVIVANPLARRVTGRGPGDSLAVNPKAAAPARRDGEAPFDPEQLPLMRALRGEASDNVATYVKNAAFPDGVHLITTVRPVRDGDGHVRGAVVTLSDVTALRHAQDRLSELATTDELTGLPNRRALRDRLELLSAEAARDRQFSVAIADIDFFKKVNDTHGHAVGDAVLVAVASTLRTCVRRSDLVARLGGEEFCVVQTDIDPDAMRMLTERLRAAVAAITAPVPITASFGACHSSMTSDPTALLEAADRALYAAKREGRNRVVVAPST
jgi:diguanylate cyclase